MFYYKISQKVMSMKKIAFTNGVFDILHLGHILFLKRASTFGKLIVGINSDNSVKKIKGPNRPIFNENYRKQMLLENKYVSNVIIFNEETPEQLIKKIRPDYIIKGADWEEKDIIGKDFIETYNGEVIRISFEIDISTTQIIESIQNGS